MYYFEYKHKIGKDGWTAEEYFQWRLRYSKEMLEKINMRLIAVKDPPCILPDDPLLAATEHALKQWHEIPRIFTSPTYRLDNNEVNRINCYIFLIRHRLTIGSHTGTEATVLYHSLAITCHQCGVNIFEYFCDIIDQCAAWPPNTPIEKYRNLLLDRWKPTQNSRPGTGRLSFLVVECYCGRLYLFLTQLRFFCVWGIVSYKLSIFKIRRTAFPLIMG